MVYALVLRAVNKINDLLIQDDYTTGICDQQDKMTSEYVKQLMIKISQDCSNSFNETALFRKNDFQQNLLLREIQDKFYNISKIFDCIGCDKCRLNGKVQITGLGAAMKILFQSRK